MKPLILAACAAPALVTGFTGMHSHHQSMPQHIHETLIQKLELTKDQQSDIHRIFDAHHPALRVGAMAIVQARAELVHALADARTTEAQIRDLEAKGSAADLVLALEVSRMVKEIDPLLSEAQRVKARQLMADLHTHVEGFLSGLQGGVNVAPKGQ